MSEAPTDRVHRALADAGCEPRRSGSGWSAKCPAHDDRNPSLSLSAGDDGRALVACHAGCTADAVCSALGLELRDLMPEADPPHRRNGQHRTPSKPKADTPSGLGFATAKEAVQHLERRHGRRSRLWTYQDADGEPVGVVVRWDGPGGKRVLPVALCEDGRWRNCAMPAPRPLHDLAAIRKSDAAPVVVVEGEPAADAGRGCEFVTTTSAGGSKAAGKADWSPLAGRDVWAVPDRDEAGERYAADVAELALKAGARSVRVVRLADRWPDLPKGGDLVDVLKAEGGDTEAVREAMEALAADTDPEEAADTAGEDDAPSPLPLADAMPEGAGVLRDYFEAVARSLQVPIEAVALPALAFASACIAKTCRVRGHGDHIEPPQLWALLLMPSGTRKSAIFSELARPIRLWERDAAEAAGPEIAAAQTRRDIADQRLREAKSRAAKAKDPGQREAAALEAEAAAAELDKITVPTLPRLTTSEPTPEALARLMVDNHERMLLASAEGGALDVALGRYASKGGAANLDIYLNGHPGDPATVDRIGRPPIRLDSPALAVAMIVQPAAVRGMFTDANAVGRGLTARFLTCAPPDLRGTRETRPPSVPDRLRKVWSDALFRLLKPEPVTEGDPPTLTLSPEADRLYHGLQRRVERGLAPGGELRWCPAWAGKLCGAALRIAAVLHALERWGIRDGRPAEGERITGPTMRAAVAWADWTVAAHLHAARVVDGEEAEGDPEARERAALLAWVRNRDGATVRDLAKSGPRRFRGKADDAEAALQALADAGVAAWEYPPTEGGRQPSKRLVPVDPAALDPESPDPNPVGGLFGSGSSGSAPESAATPPPDAEPAGDGPDADPAPTDPFDVAAGVRALDGPDGPEAELPGGLWLEAEPAPTHAHLGGL